MTFRSKVLYLSLWDQKQIRGEQKKRLLGHSEPVELEEGVEAEKKATLQQRENLSKGEDEQEKTLGDRGKEIYLTVTDLARLRGLSGSLIPCSKAK